MKIAAAAAAAKSLQSCPTPCDPIDGSPPGSPIPGILQARSLEWVAISFSNAGKWKVKVKSLSRVWLLATPWTAAYTSNSLQPHGIVHGILRVRKLEWVAIPFSRGIFPTQGLNPGLPHCRRILYQLSHQGSPRKLEWVAYPLFSISSWPRNWTRVFCTAGEFFTSWATLFQNSISKGNWKKLNLQVLLVILDRDHFLFIFVPLSLTKCLIWNM